MRGMSNEFKGVSVSIIAIAPILCVFGTAMGVEYNMALVFSLEGVSLGLFVFGLTKIQTN